MSIDLQQPVSPISVSEARTGLSQALKAFREGDGHDEPIFFGSQRKPEGVILSYRLFAQLNEAARLIEDLGDVALVRERMAVPRAQYVGLDEVADDLGIELDELQP